MNVIRHGKYRGIAILNHDGVLQMKSRSTTLLAGHHDGDPDPFLNEFKDEYGNRFSVEEYVKKFEKEHGPIQSIGDLGALITYIRHTMGKEDVYGRNDTVRWKNKILRGLRIEDVERIIREHGLIPSDAPKVLKEIHNLGYLILVASNSIQPAVDATGKEIKEKGGHIDYQKANGVLLYTPQERRIVEYSDLHSQKDYTLTGEVVRFDKGEFVDAYLRAAGIGYKSVIVVDDTPHDVLIKKVLKSGGKVLGFCSPETIKTADYRRNFRDMGIPYTEEPSFGILYEAAKEMAGK